MRRHITAWCIVALGVVTLGACAKAGAPTSERAPSTPIPGSVAGHPPTVTGSATHSPIVAPSSKIPAPKPTAPAPTAIRPLPPIGAPTPSGTGTFSLSGTIYAGAEPSCLLLMQGRIEYLLQTASANMIRVGERVVITGHLAPATVRSHCMQGRPFVVTTVDILGPHGG